MTFGASGPARDVLLAVEPEDVTAGGVGFVVIAGLAVGTVILLRSLNKQLKKVDFEEEPEGEAGSEAPVGDEPDERPDEGTSDEPGEGPKAPSS